MTSKQFVYAASLTAAAVLSRAVVARALSSPVRRSASAVSSAATTGGSGGVAKAFRGAIIHSKGLGNLECLVDGLITVGIDGIILDLVDLSQCANAAEKVAAVKGVLVEMGPTELLVPGFVDGHAHAPQYAFAGTGMDMPLLQWLETYTFPCETKFSDLEHAQKVTGGSEAKRSLIGGSTTVSWFATIHLEASKLLVDEVRRQGQRAHVGKVSMDRNSPPSYVETSTAQALRDVELFVDYVEGSADPSADVEPLVTPSIIPRFVPSCSSELMHGLGAISSTRGRKGQKMPVHSHLSESVAEIEWVKSLHPDCETYAGVYEAHGLLHERSYMAHCVHCGAGGETEVLHRTKCGVVHCASSNFMLKSGVLDVRPMLAKGVKMGLGTDIAGGYSSSMLDALRQAVIASRVASFNKPGTEPLTYAEAFHLATVGGAEVLGLSHCCGDFTPGKQLDALRVDLAAEGGPVDLFAPLTPTERFEKFLFLGDDRNIKEVFVGGNRVV